MAIPIDFEDIIGAGCYDSLRRGVAAITCVWLGCATGIAGYQVAWLVEGLVTGIPVDWDFGFWPYVLGPLLLLASFFLPWFCHSRLMLIAARSSKDFAC